MAVAVAVAVAVCGVVAAAQPGSPPVSRSQDVAPEALLGRDVSVQGRRRASESERDALLLLLRAKGTGRPGSHRGNRVRPVGVAWRGVAWRGVCAARTARLFVLPPVLCGAPCSGEYALH